MFADGGADAYYDYDALDHLVQVTLSDNLTQNQTRRFAYDGLGHPTWAENPENGTVVYGGYDALGNLLSLQDSRGNLSRSVYDFAGRLTERWLTPSGSTERLVARDTYDQDSGTGHSLGKVTKIESFDESGQLHAAEHNRVTTPGRPASVPETGCDRREPARRPTSLCLGAESPSRIRSLAPTGWAGAHPCPDRRGVPSCGYAWRRSS